MCRTADTSFHYRQALALAASKYNFEVQAGLVNPSVVPWGFLNLVVLGIWLFMTSRTQHRMPLFARLGVFCLVASLSIHSIFTYRSLGMAYGLFIGLSSGWGCAIAMNFILLKDPRLFKRLILVKSGGSGRMSPIPFVSGSSANLERIQEKLEEEKDNRPTKNMPNDQKRRLVWESCPSDGLERLAWVLDLMFSLRGTNWNWQEKAKPIPARIVQTRMTSLPRNLLRFTISYMCIDALKLVVIYDPYFTGSFDAAPQYLPAAMLAPWILHTYHLLLSFAAIYGAIFFICSLGPLFFVNILGPDVANVNAEAWMYPSAFGCVRAVPERGLAGFWGGWWHQLLRLHLESIAGEVTRVLGMKPRSDAAKFTKYTIAFTLSGLFHACGSFTLWGPTRPWATFVFFALQPVGITLQQHLGAFLSTAIPHLSNKTIVHQCGRVAYTVAWLRLTFPLFADDLANGLWLMEPLPISPLRGMGFGGDGAGGWCCWCDGATK